MSEILFECPSCGGHHFNIGVRGTLKCENWTPGNPKGCGWTGQAPMLLEAQVGAAALREALGVSTTHRPEDRQQVLAALATTAGSEMLEEMKRLRKDSETCPACKGRGGFDGAEDCFACAWCKATGKATVSEIVAEGFRLAQRASRAEHERSILIHQTQEAVIAKAEAESELTTLRRVATAAEGMANAIPCPTITAGNAHSMAYHVSTGKAFAGIDQSALEAWLRAIEKMLNDYSFALTGYKEAIK